MSGGGGPGGNPDIWERTKFYIDILFNISQSIEVLITDGKGCVKPEFQETVKKESKPDSER